MTVSDRDRNLLCLCVSPAEMEQFWSEGWRHFGIFVFGHWVKVHGGKQVFIFPLKVDLEQFALTHSQKCVYCDRIEFHLTDQEQENLRCK